MNPAQPPLAVIGGGTMARAIVAGGVERGILDPTRVAVAELDLAKHTFFTSLGVRTFDSASDTLAWLGTLSSHAPGSPMSPAQVLLAIKPQSLAPLAASLSAPALANLSGCVIISILAGTPSARVRAAFADKCPVVRAMPNTPARLGEAVTAIAPGLGARPGDETFAIALFRAVGPIVVSCDESLMDAYTAVSGSGPAYIFFLAEAMARAATGLGINSRDAERAVRQTIIGAAALLRSSDEPFAALRAAVTSKGGTTEAALASLGTAHVADSITDAIRAAHERGRTLAQA